MSDAIEEQRRATFRTVLTSLVLFTVLLIVGALATPQPHPETIAVFYAPLFVVFGASALLYRARRTRAAALVATSAIFVMVTVAVLSFGGLTGQVASAYFIVVISAALTLGARAAFAFTLAIVAAAAWLVHLQTTGRLPPAHHTLTIYDHLVSIVGTLTLAALLLRRALLVTESALRRADRNERENLGSLRALEAAGEALSAQARREAAIRDLAEHLLMTSEPAVMAQLTSLAIAVAFDRAETSLLLHVRAERTLKNATPAHTIELSAASVDDLYASVREYQFARSVSLEDAHGRRRDARAVSLLGRSNAYGVLVVFPDEPRAETKEADEALSDFITTIGRVLGSAFERIHAERQLRESQRLESLGRLASGVAHDFNNLLTVILGASAALERTVGEREKKLLSEIVQTSRRAADLTGQLLAFSSREGVEVHPIDLDEVVDSLSKILARALGADVSLELDLRSEGKRIVADRAGLEQVLMNLAVNARDAMPGGGRLRVCTRASNMPDPGLPGVDEAVILTVEDEGVGMSDEVAARIFEPFFSTKGPGHGTGLGLPTVYGVVTGLGGRVEVDSTLGEGTRFRCIFPVGDQTSRITVRQRASYGSVAPPGPIPLSDGDAASDERTA